MQSLKFLQMISHLIKLNFRKALMRRVQTDTRSLSSGFQMGWLLSPFLSLFIAKDRKNLGIGMENSQRDGFFGSLTFPYWEQKITYGQLEILRFQKIFKNFCQKY